MGVPFLVNSFIFFVNLKRLFSSQINDILCMKQLGDKQEIKNKNVFSHKYQ